jgi:hypothetical protein
MAANEKRRRIDTEMQSLLARRGALRLSAAGMKPRSLVSLLALAVFAGCTSVKVDRHSTVKHPKVPERKVEQTSQEVVAAKAHENLATVQMSTKGRFASSLPQRARKITGKLGGDAYVVTAGDTSTRITGGLMGTLADETVASMTIDVIHWKTAPAAAPKPGATPPKPGAAPAPAPAGAAQPPAAPAKKKKWYWPF